MYVNHLMAFCVGEILKCFVNCSTSITASPIDRPIKPRARSTTYTIFLQRASTGKWLFPLSVRDEMHAAECALSSIEHREEKAGFEADSPMIDRGIKRRARNCRGLGIRDTLVISRAYNLSLFGPSRLSSRLPCPVNVKRE